MLSFSDMYYVLPLKINAQQIVKKEGNPFQQIIKYFRNAIEPVSRIVNRCSGIIDILSNKQVKLH